MSGPRVYRVMRDQVIRKMRRKEIREILFSYIYRPSEEFVECILVKWIFLKMLGNNYLIKIEKNW